MKTDIIILGAQKCATTTLFDILCECPGVIGCREKEPDFFSTCDDWRKDLGRYEALFPRQGPAARYCEASTSYTFHPHRNPAIWKDLHAYNPAMRLIYLVRNPVDRIISSYMHNIARGYTRASLEDFVWASPLPIDVSRYHQQIRPYLETFGENQVLLVDFADLVISREQVLARVADFLGLDRHVVLGARPKHSNDSARDVKRPHQLDRFAPLLRQAGRAFPASWRPVAARLVSAPPQPKPRPTRDLHRGVIDILSDDIDRLERIMEKDFSAWRRFDG